MNTLVLMAMGEQRGGAEQMLLDLVRHAPAGHRFTTAFLEEGSLVRRFREEGHETYVVPAGRLRQPVRFARTVEGLAALARRTRADLLLSWSSKPHLYGSLAGLLARTPTAWYQLGLPAGRHLHPIDRLATRLPGLGVLTLSAAAQRAQAALPPHRPTPLVYPAVDLARFSPERLPAPAEARRRLGLPEDVPLVGIVGRLQRWKGMHTLVEAMPALVERHPRAHAVIVGGRHEMEADYEDALRGRIGTLGLGERVTMAGHQDDIPLWMQAMDIVVHASDREPFGIVVVEAMGLGKPLVAGSEGGPAEIVTPGVDGLLVPFDDARALASALDRLLSDPDGARRMGEAARRRAQDFSPEAFARNVADALDALAGPAAPNAEGRA